MIRFLLPAGFALCLAVLIGMPSESPAQPPGPGPAPPRPGRAEEELVDKVRKTIEKGVGFLKKEQQQGKWEGIVINTLADMEGGVTSLVALALLNCGERPDSPAVADALRYLRTVEPKKTYVVGLQTMVFAEARSKADLPLVQRNAQWLIEQGLGWKVDNNGQVIGGRLEGWSYPENRVADNSNTQYALLGLYAAKTAGAQIHDSVWRGIQDYYARTQQKATETSGFWGYYNDPRFGGNVSSFSMSVAGVCGLFIAGMGLDQSEQQLDPASGVAKNCGAYSENTALAKGLNWVAANFNFYLDAAGQSKSAFYNTYGIERLGRLSGQRFIDKHDWYRDGCQKLVRLQGPDGSIVAPSGSGIDSMKLISTSFALLFLSKGRTPVLISKFAWGDFQNRGNGSFIEVPIGPEGQVNWNRKHNDTRHIVEFCSQELFKGAPLSWQVYDVRRRDFGNDQVAGGKSGKEKILEEVGILLQSPLLYINGHGPIGGREGLTGTQKEILKTYLEEGGFLVAEACCGDKAFADSFKELMKELFPENDFKRMSPEHAIWQMHPGITPLDFPEVEVLERGCRTAAVFSPIPLAGYWEEAKYIPKDGKNPTNRGEKAYCLVRNIVAYATGGELPKPKLTRQHLVAKDGPEVGVTRSYFKAAQLRLRGDPEPAPDALKNLMGYLRDNARLEVAIDSVVVLPHDEQLSTFKFNYLHGRKPLQFDEAAIENLQSNLNTGGLLFADAACGGFEQWKEFDKSFRAMCEKLYPGKKLTVIPEFENGKEDPLFKIAREAVINIKAVKCRRETPDGKGPEPGEPKTVPVLLEGIKIDGRWVVIYSKYDVGCAIEGHKSAECLGHDKDSAMRIASAVVLYSLKR